MVINYNEEIMYVIINTFFSGNLLKITKYYISLTFYLVWVVVWYKRGR